MAFSPLYNPQRNLFDVNVFHEPTVTKLAEKYKKQNTQIVLRFLVSTPFFFFLLVHWHKTKICAKSTRNSSVKTHTNLEIYFTKEPFKIAPLHRRLI